MSTLENRYDFVFLFDVSDGNPNGDPDAGNLPRMDPETSQGLVTDVALKRKVRDYVATTRSKEEGYAIYMSEGVVLNEQHAKAYEANGIKIEKKKQKEEDARKITRWMCDNFFDIRAFGAVMSTDVNAGQVRGPLQLAFARSIDPIMPIDISITRSSVTNEKDRDKERTMGRKHIVPYGLYRAHGYVNANLAERTGFSVADLELFWEAMREMFEHDRSASRGTMAARRGIAFKHSSKLGDARAHELFERVTVWRKVDGDKYRPGDRRLHNMPASRAFDDYEIAIDRNDLPEGVEIVEFC